MLEPRRPSMKRVMSLDTIHEFLEDDKDEIQVVRYKKARL
jgi:hypothetical protein